MGFCFSGSSGPSATREREGGNKGKRDGGKKRKGKIAFEIRTATRTGESTAGDLNSVIWQIGRVRVDFRPLISTPSKD